MKECIGLITWDTFDHFIYNGCPIFSLISEASVSARHFESEGERERERGRESVREDVAAWFSFLGRRICTAVSRQAGQGTNKVV
jgi:hypothetical protein